MINQKNKLTFLIILLAVFLAGCQRKSTQESNMTTNKAEAKSQVPMKIIDEFMSRGEDEKAFELLKAVARAGDDRAQFKLGAYYANGISGVLPVDYVTAMAWIKLSLMERTGFGRARAVEQLNQVLTTEEITQAQKRAELLFKQYGTGKRIYDLSAIKTWHNPVPQECGETGTRLKDSCKSSGNVRVIKPYEA